MLIVQTAVNGRALHFVSNAAPCTKVLKGLGVAVRCICHRWQLRSYTRYALSLRSGAARECPARFAAHGLRRKPISPYRAHHVSSQTIPVGSKSAQDLAQLFQLRQYVESAAAEMNAGKLILINTSKSLLKEQGTEIFGRFFIALIAQAAQERATLPDYDRIPTMVYIDEAQDYFDQNIGVILSQARKYRVGMIMAHQYLGQLSNGLQEAFEANTSIKLAGGVSARDARALAGQMSAEVDLIQRQPKGTFATYVRGLTQRAVPISFPFFVLENLTRATKDEIDAIRQHSRNAYAEPWHPKADQGGTSEDSPQDPPTENDGDDPLKPSPEL